MLFDTLSPWSVWVCIYTERCFLASKTERSGVLRGKAGEECVLRGSAEPAGTASPQDAPELHSAARL